MPPPYCYKYPRPMVTVDLVVFALAHDGLRSLFIKRNADPFAGFWAIPGGYLEMDERIGVAACRELEEETGLKDVKHVEQIGVFDEIDRDPRGRTISFGHAAVVGGPLPEVAGGDDAREAAWLDPAKVERLAFDHGTILDRAKDWLARSLHRDEIVFQLLPETFRKEDVETLFRAVLGKNGRGSRWLTTHVRSGKIREIPDSPGRFRAEIKREDAT
ncbi:MAG: ADP-ribose pyrophosphatase [Planctomycetota bacterium]|nr:ADP-ribose pyrophosphatase [Planctomycetota bacterium]